MWPKRVFTSFDLCVKQNLKIYTIAQSGFQSGLNGQQKTRTKNSMPG
jgi:hypothetical protein